MKAHSVDSNQADIVEALRKAGASVQILSAVGQGCPDLAVAYRGVNHFVEIKDRAKPPSARKLTPDQEKWMANWRGPVYVVDSIAQAFAAIGIKCSG